MEKKYISEKEYSAIVETHTPKSKHFSTALNAFLIGGAICAFGQGIINLYEYFGFNTDDSSVLTAITLVFVSAMLTGLKLYDKIAKYGGAGTLIPITGFANSVVSPAIEFKSEGYIYGVGAKMFIIAGPVLVFGVISSVVCGLFAHMYEYLTIY